MRDIKAEWEALPRPTAIQTRATLELNGRMVFLQVRYVQEAYVATADELPSLTAEKIAAMLQEKYGNDYK